MPTFLELLARRDISWTVNSDGSYWAYGCDWSGNDLSSVLTPSADCGSTCIATSGCTNLAWTDYNGETLVEDWQYAQVCCCHVNNLRGPAGCTDDNALDSEEEGFTAADYSAFLVSCSEIHPSTASDPCVAIRLPAFPAPAATTLFALLLVSRDSFRRAAAALWADPLRLLTLLTAGLTAAAREARHEAFERVLAASVAMVTDAFFAAHAGEDHEARPPAVADRSELTRSDDPQRLSRARMYLRSLHALHYDMVMQWFTAFDQRRDLNRLLPAVRRIYGDARAADCTTRLIPAWPHLTHLDIFDDSQAAIAALAEYALLPCLRSLSVFVPRLLGDSALDRSVAALILSVARSRSLTRLKLSRFACSPNSMAAVAALADSLSELALMFVTLPELPSSLRLPQLRSLRIRANGVAAPYDVVAASIASFVQHHLAEGGTLHTLHCHIAGVREEQPEELPLAGCLPQPESLPPQFFTHLRSLRISFMAHGDSYVGPAQLLLALDLMVHLEDLTIEHVACHIAPSTLARPLNRLPQLRRLELHSVAAVDDNFAYELSCFSRFPRLSVLALTYDQMTSRGRLVLLETMLDDLEEPVGDRVFPSLKDFYWRDGGNHSPREDEAELLMGVQVERSISVRDGHASQLMHMRLREVEDIVYWGCAMPPEALASRLALPLVTALGGAQALWWPPATAGTPRVVVLFITGNPGVPSYYTPFLDAIYSAPCLAHPSAAPGAIEILALAQRGHAALPPIGSAARSGGEPNGASARRAASGRETGLRDQVAHKLAALDAIRAMYPDRERTRLVIVGHSIGAWMAVELLKARPAAIDSLHLLFPTLAWIGRTSNARSLRLLVSPPVADFVLPLPVLLLALLPLFLLVRIVGLVTRQPLPAAVATTELLTTPGAVRNALRMGRAEFDTLQGLDDDTVRAVHAFVRPAKVGDAAAGGGGFLRTYWGADESDAWAPDWIRTQVETEFGLQRVRLPRLLKIAPRDLKPVSAATAVVAGIPEDGSKDGPTSDSDSDSAAAATAATIAENLRTIRYHYGSSRATSTHCSVGMPHAFCLNHSEDMADIVAHWIAHDHFGSS
ncbi:hypothetical protein HK405_000975 [Cladochytrium tenue]|nr:hypothetical protein HK405_000975 [Cladochytrium tenue]